MDKFIKKMKDCLLAKRAELRKVSATNLKECIEIGQTRIAARDELERLGLQQEEALIHYNGASRTDQLNLIEEALARIEGHTYGICQDCGEEISTRRLEAIPWAAYCLACENRRKRRTLGSQEVARNAPISF